MLPLMPDSPKEAHRDYKEPAQVPRHQGAGRRRAGARPGAAETCTAPCPRATALRHRPVTPRNGGRARSCNPPARPPDATECNKAGLSPMCTRR